MPLILSGGESGEEENKNQNGNLFYLSVAAAPLFLPAQGALNPKATAMAQRPVFRPKLAVKEMTLKLQYGPPGRSLEGDTTFLMCEFVGEEFLDG